MGIFVSRLVSRQLDRLTKRLLRGQLNIEIQNFRVKLAAVLKSFTERPPTLAKEKPSPSLDRAVGLIAAIARYWRHEAQEPDLAVVIPSRAANRLLGNLI